MSMVSAQTESRRVKQGNLRKIVDNCIVILCDRRLKELGVLNGFEVARLAKQTTEWVKRTHPSSDKKAKGKLAVTTDEAPEESDEGFA